MDHEDLDGRFGVIRALYDAHARRDIDRALSFLVEDVEWPNVAAGTTLHGHDEVRRYWEEQFRAIDPHVTPTHMEAVGDTVVVSVHQIVKDLTGDVIREGDVEHVFTFHGDRVQSMQVR